MFLLISFFCDVAATVDIVHQDAVALNFQTQIKIKISKYFCERLRYLKCILENNNPILEYFHMR